MHSLLGRYLEQLQSDAAKLAAEGNADFVVVLADTSDTAIRGFIRRIIETPFPLSEHYAKNEVILHAARNEAMLNRWKLWVMSEASLDSCLVGMFSRHPSMA